MLLGSQNTNAGSGKLQVGVGLTSPNRSAYQNSINLREGGGVGKGGVARNGAEMVVVFAPFCSLQVECDYYYGESNRFDFFLI